MSPAGATGFAGRVLVLDDDPEVGRTIATIVRRAGLDCRVAPQGDAFMADIMSWAPTHLVIDLMMPGMDGIGVLRRLGEAACALPIVIVSGADAPVLETAERVGLQSGLDIVAVLSKPFTFSAWHPFLTLSAAQRRPFAGEDAVAPGFAPGGAQFRAGRSRGPFRLAYQPKVACANGALAGFEALLRWHHPDQGELEARAFIGEAERCGVMVELTDFVMREAMAFAARCGNGNLILAVNVAPACFADADFVDRLTHLCDLNELASERLMLELPEGMAAGTDAGLLEALARLRMRGVRLAIDNFGRGGASLHALARLPIHELKLDRAAVLAVAHSAEARRIVAATVGMARGLGLTTVAAGVETLDAFRLLAEAGCDFAQGFFIGRPMQAHHASAWMGGV